jgi:hypothetical protein
MSDSSFYSNTGTTSASISSITTLNAAATASKNAAAASATASANSATASEASNAAALVSKNSAATSASTATTKANLATSNGATQVALATTQANLATSNGAAKVTLATAQVALAATQAALATSNGAAKVTLATAQVALATTQANLATSNGAAKVALATTQANLATSNGAAKVALATAQVVLATAQTTAATAQKVLATEQKTLSIAQVALATTKANNAATSATASAASAAAALVSKNAAAASQTSASNSASTATSEASDSETAAAAALVSKNAAAASAAAALVSKNAAAASASAASTSSSSSTTAKTASETARDLTLGYRNTASGHSSTATTKASEASTSAGTAATKATEGAASAAAALVSKNAAAASASTASTQASNASTSAAAALSNKNLAVAAKAAAETAETNSESARDLSIASKNTSTTQASASGTSAAAALVSKNAAAASASAAATSLTSFTDVYKGSASSAPSGSLGDLYYDTNSNSLKVYNGSAWVAAYISAAGYANLSGSTFTGNVTVPNLVLVGSGTVDGRDVSADGTKLDGVAASANNYTHPNHSGVVTSTADGATAMSSNVALPGSPTTTTQSATDNSTKIATTAYADAAVAALADSAPGTLNTLNEIAAALGDDANYAASTTTAIGLRMPKSGGAFTGALTTNSTFDGRDVATDGTKLDGIASSANNYSHPTGAGNNHVPTGGSSGQFLKYSASGVAVWAADNNTTYSVGDGELSQINFTSADHSKLNGIAASANNYTHPNHSGDVVSSADGATTIQVDAVDIAMLSATGTASSTTFLRGDNAWVTPTDTNTTYSVGDGGLSQINFTSADHSKLNGIAASANNYSHPSGAGNNHVPTGGSSGQFLKYSSSGVAVWAADNNTTYSVGDGGLSQINFTSSRVSKLNGIAASANNYSHPSGAGNNHIPSGGSSGQFLKYSSSGVAVWAADNNTDTNTTYSVGDGGLSEINFTSADHSKLNGIAASANNYSHPSGAGNNHVPTGGSSGQFLKYSSSGVAVWAADNNTDTNTTYSADGNYGMTLSGTAFRLEDDRRRNSSTVDIYTGNTHDYTMYDASDGIRWFTAGAEDMRLTDAGDLHVDGNITAYSTTISDERLKTDISTVENALDKVKQIRGVEFTRIKDGVRSAGVIAQELEKVLPQAITETALPYESDTETEFKTVDYDAIHALLIESIKELSAKIDALENK